MFAGICWITLIARVHSGEVACGPQPHVGVGLVVGGGYCVDYSSLNEQALIALAFCSPDGLQMSSDHSLSTSSGWGARRLGGILKSGPLPFSVM